VRVYLPAVLDQLPSEQVGPGRAHAVTPELRAGLPGEDDEAWEYAALLATADDALALLRQHPGSPRLRVVLAADVPDGLVDAATGPDEAASAVDLVAGVPWDAVVSIHVDEPAAAPDVLAALTGDRAADERLVERELLWYDVTEVGRIPC
jgi:non-ribosomal peptide synthetase component F